MAVEISGVRYYSTAAVLTEVDVSRQTLWRWRKDGLIPQGHRFRNGRLLFTRAEFDAILSYANRIEPDTVVGNANGRSGHGLGATK